MTISCYLYLSHPYFSLKSSAYITSFSLSLELFCVAFTDERYDYAQNCKEAVELLQKAGLRLGKYEIEKRLAIEEENYDRAKQKKDHIDEYKSAVMEALKVEQLMEDDGVSDMGYRFVLTSYDEFN